MDFNLQSSTNFSSGSEECSFENDGGVKTNIKGAEHPIWSNELVNTINNCRKWANSKEDLLNGQIQDSVFESMVKAQTQTKFPADLLAFMMDLS